MAQLEEHQNIVHKICRLDTNDSDAHNDLFRGDYHPIGKAYPKFRGDAKFSTWMYRVALNTAITLYRKKTKRTVQTQDYESVSFGKVSSEAYDPTVEDQLKLMYNAVKTLSDVDKALVFVPGK